jgi:hypothetical protein
MMVKTAALLKGTSDYHTGEKLFLFGEAYTEEWFQENCANTSQSKAVHTNITQSAMSHNECLIFFVSF